MKNSTTRQGDPAPIGWTIGHAPLWLRGIRLAEGEGGATPPAPAAPAAPAPTPTPQPASPAAPAAAPLPSPALFAQQQAPQPAAPPTFSQDYVHELREEARVNRISRDEFKSKHEESETARTAAESALAEAQAKLVSLQRESAVRTAAEGIANPALLLDSASFLKSLAEVNLDDAEAVKAAVTKHVEQNSAYSTTPTLPGTSGGTPSGGGEAKPTTLAGAIGARLGG